MSFKQKFQTLDQLTSTSAMRLESFMKMPVQNLFLLPVKNLLSHLLQPVKNEVKYREGEQPQQSLKTKDLMFQEQKEVHKVEILT